MTDATTLPDNAIEVRGLKKTYAGSKKAAPKTALHGVDLAVKRGPSSDSWVRTAPANRP